MKINALHFYLINDGNFRVTEKKMDAPASGASTLLACRQLLIDTGREKILIDTGIGNKSYNDDYFAKFAIITPRQLLPSLTECGIRPAEISHLVLTHLHFDHAGGFGSICSKGTLTTPFTRAEVIVQKSELEHAGQQMQNGGNSYVAQNLNPVLASPNSRIIDGDLQLTGGIKLIRVRGHSGGNQLVRFVDNQQIYYFAGDLLPTPYHINIAANPPGIDHDPKIQLQNKLRLLNLALKEEAIIIFNHSPALHAGKITACQNGRYQFKSIKLKENSVWTVL